MLATPQTITIDAVANTLNRIEDDKTSSLYKTDDGELELKVSHQSSKTRTRRMARVDQTVIAADPLTAVNAYQKLGVYIVIDEPLFGFEDAQILLLVNGLKDWMSTANITALLASRH
jgi:hypothetical protein